MRLDRWEKILQSAVLQSQQHYIPVLADVTPLDKALAMFNGSTVKLIAHCINDEERVPLSKMLNRAIDTVMLIGPEGDFTPNEVNLCVQKGFKAVSLGNQRLRTETAAITAAAFFNVMNAQ
jgi:16S rRNA (uracil1498-N3)-methyltransferase